ncbi:restriction endonuclease subunit S [Cytobacillus praedii]|uniref:restriction endonuclease subunit S n=1 Tax=Cytobacillus praedii TaxID=1742358 RepID=UPI002E1F906A|nr:restriction endonuclease subunit S [Cytobacillus praedii]MED3550928.1 restriction endonuclease subunit S [Cytobacillus praedii]
MKYIALKDVFSIKKGKKVEQVEFKNDHTVRYIQIDDLRNNSQVKYCNKEENYVYVDPNDIVIAWDGANAGTVGYGLDGAIGSTLAKLEVKTEELFVPFVALYLQSKFNYFQSTATGATIPHISRNALESIGIPLISLEKQKEIFNVLKKTQNTIEKRQSQIAALDELTQSVFFKMFQDKKDFSKVSIEQVVESIEAGWSVSGEERAKEEKEIAVLKISAVTKGYFNDNEYKVLNPNIEIKKAVYPQKGDILFSRANTRELVGASAIVPKDYKDLILPDKLWKINLRKGIITPEYFHTVINTKKVRNEFSKNATGTSGSMLNISMQKFKRVEINLPSIEKQQLFSAKFIQIQQMKQKLISSKEEMNVLYNSLLQKAFKGELFQEWKLNESVSQRS